MSFSNAPDEATLGRVAGALAVDEAFVEKDWFVVQAIRGLIALGHADIEPVFSGGTALLKGHGLIMRFSEDIDFKLALSDAFMARAPGQQRTMLRAFRKALIAAWTEAGFTVTSVTSRNAGAFVQIEMDYPSLLPPHGSLRPHILAELSAKPPRLPPQTRALTSFVAQYAKRNPEVAEIACVDPIETAADKLSAFTWRMLLRDRSHENDDPTIVRHLHDLTMLEQLAASHGDFAGLVRETFDADRDRGQGQVAHLSPAERLAMMRAKLGEDPMYADEYKRFVGGMTFGREGAVPSFEAALAAVQRLSNCLES